MKKAIIICVIVFLNLIFTNSFSQTVIENHYGISSTMSLKGISVCKMYDDNYLVLCKADTLEELGPGMPVSIEPAYIVKITPQGDSIWTKEIVIYGLEYLYDMDETPDDGFIILASTYQNEMVLVKIGLDGNIVWQQNIPGIYSLGTFPTSLAVANDGGFIITGEHLNENIDVFCSYLLKTDSEGNQLWFEDSYNITYNTKGVGVVQDTDGNIYFCGRYDPAPGGGGWDHDIYLVKADNTGNMIWEKIIANPPYPDYAVDIIITNDNHIAITGKSYVDGNGYLTTIAKVDLDGNTVFFKNIYNGEITGLDIKQAPSGNYFIAGRGFFGNDSHEFNVIKLDPNGNVIWSDYYTWFPIHYAGLAMGQANEIEIIGDDSYLAIGWMYYNEPILIGSVYQQAAHMYIVTPEITTGMERINHVANVSVFPNPMRNRATITFENPNNVNHTLEVFDMQGSRVITTTNITSNKVSIEKNNLPGGMYFYKLIQNSNLITTGKIIIE